LVIEEICLAIEDIDVVMDADGSDGHPAGLECAPLNLPD